jgi:hypothetical protein
MNATSIALWFAMTGSCLATNVGLSTIEQPVNLGAESDPTRIPLGRVAVESNYHYGRGPVISAARPSLHGPMEWKSGAELEQNLASAFGIEVSNHDIPHAPATIRLKSWPVPAYSPYTKEQVLAASIHCLLRSNRGTPSQPIELKVVADAKDDEALAKRYAGSYVNSPDRPEAEPVEATPVVGTKIETDSRGISWVSFPEAKPAESPGPRPPVMIPFRLGGESEPDNPLWQLIPVWTGTGRSLEQSLEILGQPYPLFYDCFNPSTGGGPEANALFAENPRGAIFSLDVSTSDAGTEALFCFPGGSSETLAASILALVVSTQPTPENPLTVTLETHLEKPPEWFANFKQSADWSPPGDPMGKARRRTLACTFVWDSENAVLTRGSVPLAGIMRTATGELVIEASSAKPPETQPNEPLPAKTPKEKADGTHPSGAPESESTR